MSTEPSNDVRENRPAASAESSPAADSAPAPAPSAENLEETVQKLLAEKQQLFDQLLRKQADVENFRKRVAREKDEFLQYALFHALESLLPILDGFELALDSEGGGEDYHKGMELIHKQFLEALQKLGLEVIEAKGHEFNPHLHEAIATVETNEYPDHAVVDELQRGYFFKQRLLRPAMVKVAKQPAVGDAQKETDALPE